MLRIHVFNRICNIITSLLVVYTKAPRVYTGFQQPWL